MEKHPIMKSISNVLDFRNALAIGSPTHNNKKIVHTDMSTVFTGSMYIWAMKEGINKFGPLQVRDIVFKSKREFKTGIK